MPTYSFFSLPLDDGSNIGMEYNLIKVIKYANEIIAQPAMLHKTSYKSGKFGGGWNVAWIICRAIIPTKHKFGTDLHRKKPENTGTRVWPTPPRLNHIIDANIVTIQKYALCSRSTCINGHNVQTQTIENHSTKIGSSQNSNEQGAIANSILFSCTWNEARKKLERSGNQVGNRLEQSRNQVGTKLETSSN